MTQEIALRLGNCLAPLLTSSRKSRLLVTALAQCVHMRDTGAARDAVRALSVAALRAGVHRADDGEAGS